MTKRAGMGKWLYVLVLILICGGVAEAMQTKIIVRAKSKDAKFIGSSMGGAQVVVKDSGTGEVLSKGLISGGTGNTQKIMIDPVKRSVPIADATAALFETAIDIKEPKLVTIEVSGPLSPRQSMVTSSTQAWLIPGKDMTSGDGIVIEVPGFSVNALAPMPNETLRLTGGKVSVPIAAHIVMM